MVTGAVEFVAYDEAFGQILGSGPSAHLLAESSEGLPLYHEACVYHRSTQSVFVTSNQIARSDGSKYVILSRISLSRESSKDAHVEAATPDALSKSFLNGGVNHGDDLLMCAQGSRSTDDLSGLILISSKDGAVTPVVTDFHGIPFNSVNDVVIHPEDGSIWFTDPCYGYHQGIRPAPQLPNQVYRFDAKTKSVRAVAEGFVRPNGICFSPYLETVYITDTGAIHGSADVAIDPAGPSHIYAFDLIDDFLVNRRLFAYAPGRFPDGIKCDMAGNVYAGCGDGVEVWNKEGTLLGVIKVQGGVANFCFGEKGAMFLCNETRFWMVQLRGEGVKGSLLGL